MLAKTTWHVIKALSFGFCHTAAMYVHCLILQVHFVMLRLLHLLQDIGVLHAVEKLL